MYKGATYLTIILSLAFTTALVQFPSAYGQSVIPVNQTVPCFQNYTAGADMWRNCGVEDDWLVFFTLPWEYITGGLFSMILVSLFILMTWIKYHKVVYPLMIGTAFIPISYALFPQVFLIWSIIFAGIGVAILVWYAFVRQTKEY